MELVGEGLVLDVGGWANPFDRADYVLDEGAYETRSLGYHGVGKLPKSVIYRNPRPGERFTKATWIMHDACDPKPFPFPDKFFDFVICSHTLEDLRDPGRVCSEMQRVGNAGFIETPSRLAEQTHHLPPNSGIGSPHHHWLVESVPNKNKISFLAKPDGLSKSRDFYVPGTYFYSRSPLEHVLSFYWNGSFSCEVSRDYNWQANCRSLVSGLNIPTWYYWRDALKGIQYRLIGKRRRDNIAQVQKGDEELWTWPALFEANARFKPVKDKDASGVGD